MDDYYVVADPTNIINTSGVFILNSVGYEFLRRFSKPLSASDLTKSEITNIERLLRTKLLVSSSKANLMPFFNSPKTLISRLHVTNACPLQCKYCYINKNAEHMSIETGRNAVKVIFRETIKHKFAKVILKYAGGEPCLNLDLVEELHKLADKKTQEQGIYLDELIITSGVISAHDIKRIIGMGTKVTISLDALGEEHDVQRPLLNGKPSGHITQNTLKVMKEAGVKVGVSTTVAKQSAEALIELIDFLLEIDVPFRLNYVRDNSNFVNQDDFKPENSSLIEKMTKVISHFCHNPPKHSLLGSLIERGNPVVPYNYRCAAGNNYLAIDHQGRISKCQQEMNTPITTIDDIDPLIKIRNNNLGLKNLPVEKKESCSICEWRYWCSGGCPALTKYTYGRYDIPSPFCEVYKAIIPEAVKLEGLRLLKYYGPD